MKLLTLLILGLGLSMDCFAVAVGTGFSNKQLKPAIFLIAISFGVAHFIMPLLGWIIGDAFKVYIQSFDHWIAFVLLTGIGLKMFIESFKADNQKSFTVDKVSVIVLLSIATSIDALIIGMSLALLSFNLIISAAVISFFAFIISFIGFNIGKKFGCYCGNKAEILGGLILIAIGIKVLVEHIQNNI